MVLVEALLAIPHHNQMGDLHQSTQYLHHGTRHDAEIHHPKQAHRIAYLQRQFLQTLLVLNL